MKALFFLRHYNDIDHVTPVIYKWIGSGHQCDVVLIGSTQFRRDFRVKYLSQLQGVRVAHMKELFPPSMGLMTANFESAAKAPHSSGKKLSNTSISELSTSTQSAFERATASLTDFPYPWFSGAW